MRRSCLMAAMLAVACAEAPPPPAAPHAPAMAAPVARPVAAGTPEEQASRRLQRALNQDAAADRLRSASPTGEPFADPYDIGGGGQAPVMPDQVSPAFRGL